MLLVHYSKAKQLLLQKFKFFLNQARYYLGPNSGITLIFHRFQK